MIFRVILRAILTVGESWGKSYKGKLEIKSKHIGKCWKVSEKVENEICRFTYCMSDIVSYISGNVIK